LLAWRASLTRQEVARRSGSVAAHVLAWPLWRQARAVLLYLATPREVQTGSLVEAALDSGKAVVAPGLDGLLRRLADPAAVRRSRLRVPEPDPARCPEFPVDRVELAFVPGVAFDRAGRRLGRGAGYYDRLLPRLRCPTCGLAFVEQVVEAVPADPWDIPLDFLVSEDGVGACVRTQ
jgi:5-formyltetrahydrofolate cyclo-ligase